MTSEEDLQLDRGTVLPKVSVNEVDAKVFELVPLSA